jgi:hypothetical protein
VERLYEGVRLKRVHRLDPRLRLRIACNLLNMDEHDHDHDHDQDHDHGLKSQQSHAPSGFMQDTPPRADVDEILRRKRKAREYKVSLSAPVPVYREEMVS